MINVTTPTSGSLLVLDTGLSATLSVARSVYTEMEIYIHRPTANTLVVMYDHTHNQWQKHATCQVKRGNYYHICRAQLLPGIHISESHSLCSGNTHTALLYYTIPRDKCSVLKTLARQKTNSLCLLLLSSSSSTSSCKLISGECITHQEGDGEYMHTV